MTVEQKLLQFIDDRAEEVLQFTKELIATPSETPPGDERQIAKVILDKLERIGLNGAVVASEVPERPNVLYRLQGSNEGPTLLYVAHTDTKPVGDARNQWQTDPFEATIKDGKLYGLGASDMKAAVAAFVYAAAALKQVAPLDGSLLLALVADEEGGGRYGAHYLCTHYGLKADMCLIGEPPGVTREWEYIHLGCRGVCCFNIKVYGTQMHSSLSDRLPSVNASLKLAELMLRMKNDLTLNSRHHPMCPNGVTINIGVRLKGGVYFGVYPGYAEFGTDIRTVPGMQREALLEDVKAFLKDRQREDPSLRVEFELAAPPGDWIAPTEVSADLPIAQALASASEKVLGFRPPFGIYPAGTDSPNFQIKANIPTIPSFGAGMISVCHAANEWVGAQSIVRACKIYALAAFDVLRKRPNVEIDPSASPRDVV
jgi:acetylornithine deacetylase/succinyl-diaminopimelate desuccinylase family protein